MAAKIQKEKSLLLSVTESFQELADQLDELDILVEYAKEGDESSASEGLTLLASLGSKIAEQKKPKSCSNSHQKMLEASLRGIALSPTNDL